MHLSSLPSNSRQARYVVFVRMLNEGLKFSLTSGGRKARNTSNLNDKQQKKKPIIKQLSSSTNKKLTY